MSEKVASENIKTIYKTLKVNQVDIKTAKMWIYLIKKLAWSFLLIHKCMLKRESYIQGKDYKIEQSHFSLKVTKITERITVKNFF